VELRRYLQLIRQRTFLIALSMVIGAAVGWFITPRAATYTASSEIYVGSQNFVASPNELFAEQGLNEVVTSFAAMIPSPVIAQGAIDRTGLPRYAGEVAGSTVATVVTGTSLISVSVTDANAADAVKLANGVAHSFVTQVSKYQTGASKPSAGTVPYEPAYVFQNATSALTNGTGLTKRVVLGVIFGFVVSIFLIFLLDYLDVTVKSPEELERRVGLPVLGVIPAFGSLPLDASPSSMIGTRVRAGVGRA
jgi:capsular polysaccharide biosynthesis protein